LPKLKERADFESAVMRYITANELPVPGSTVIVGLSGGADSVCLAAVMTALGYDVVGAHANFRLRGEESLRDRDHARHIAEALDIELCVRDFDVRARMRETGESVEMACRSLRYGWFETLLESYRARAVAVGHHREDNVETMLLNLLRGTGMAGLRGMAPRHRYVIRPLLEQSRRDIESYVRARSLTWVDDSSNATDDYKRNRLRHHILPAIEEQFGATAIDAILESGKNVRAGARLYARLVGDAARGLTTTSAPTESGEPAAENIDLNAMTQRYDAADARTLLYEMLKSRGFNGDVAGQILASYHAGHSGKTFSTPQAEATLTRGVLSVYKRDGRKTVDEEITVNLRRDVLTPVGITVTEHDISEFTPPVRGDRSRLYLDATVLEQGTHVSLRRWRKGDRMAPYGMKGTKLVSDIMTEAGMSAVQKRNAWLLTCNGEILWVVGVRASRKYALTPATRRYLMLHVR